MWLVIDYFTYVARPGASPHVRLIARLSSSISPTPRI
jgi:hypothetical protein